MLRYTSTIFFTPFQVTIRIKNKNDDCKSRKKKLRGFKNWPQRTNLIQTMHEEKEVWDVVDGSRTDSTTAAQTRKKKKDNFVAFKIIKQGVNSDLYISIIREQDPHWWWEILRQVCSQIGQDVIYSILKKLLNYPRIMKLLGYEKKATTIFTEVKQLVQRFQSTVIEQRTIWDSITLVVALDWLHDNFEMTTTPFLHSDKKDIKKIQQIVIFTKKANLPKYVVGATADLTMIAKRKLLERSNLR